MLAKLLALALLPSIIGGAHPTHSSPEAADEALRPRGALDHFQAPVADDLRTCDVLPQSSPLAEHVSLFPRSMHLKVRNLQNRASLSDAHSICPSRLAVVKKRLSQVLEVCSFKGIECNLGSVMSMRDLIMDSGAYVGAPHVPLADDIFGPIPCFECPIYQSHMMLKTLPSSITTLMRHYVILQRRIIAHVARLEWTTFKALARAMLDAASGVKSDIRRGRFSQMTKDAISEIRHAWALAKDIEDLRDQSSAACEAVFREFLFAVYPHAYGAEVKFRDELVAQASAIDIAGFCVPQAVGLTAAFNIEQSMAAIKEVSKRLVAERDALDSNHNRDIRSTYDNYMRFEEGLAAALQPDFFDRSRNMKVKTGVLQEHMNSMHEFVDGIYAYVRKRADYNEKIFILTTHQIVAGVNLFAAHTLATINSQMCKSTEYTSSFVSEALKPVDISRPLSPEERAMVALVDRIAGRKRHQSTRSTPAAPKAAEIVWDKDMRLGFVARIESGLALARSSSADRSDQIATTGKTLTEVAPSFGKTCQELIQVLTAMRSETTDPCKHGLVIQSHLHSMSLREEIEAIEIRLSSVLRHMEILLAEQTAFVTASVQEETTRSVLLVFRDAIDGSSDMEDVSRAIAQAAERAGDIQSRAASAVRATGNAHAMATRNVEHARTALQAALSKIEHHYGRIERIVRTAIDGKRALVDREPRLADIAIRNIAEQAEIAGVEMGRMLGALGEQRASAIALAVARARDNAMEAISTPSKLKAMLRDTRF